MVDSLKGGRRVGGGIGLLGLEKGPLYRTVVAGFVVVVSRVLRALILWKACCCFSCFWPLKLAIPRPIADSGSVSRIIAALSHPGPTGGSG